MPTAQAFVALVRASQRIKRRNSTPHVVGCDRPLGETDPAPENDAATGAPSKHKKIGGAATRMRGESPPREAASQRQRADRLVSCQFIGHSLLFQKRLRSFAGRAFGALPFDIVSLFGELATRGLADPLQLYTT